LTTITKPSSETAELLKTATNNNSTQLNENHFKGLKVLKNVYCIIIIV